MSLELLSSLLLCLHLFTLLTVFTIYLFRHPPVFTLFNPKPNFNVNLFLTAYCYMLWLWLRWYRVTSETSTRRVPFFVLQSLNTRSSTIYVWFTMLSSVKLPLRLRYIAHFLFFDKISSFELLNIQYNIFLLKSVLTNNSDPILSLTYPWLIGLTSYRLLEALRRQPHKMTCIGWFNRSLMIYLWVTSDSINSCY